MNRGLARWSEVVGWGTAVMVTVGMYFAFIWVPPMKGFASPESTRIFYFHMPIAIVALAAFGVVFVASIIYLWRRSLMADLVALAAAEVGLVFCTLAIVTGSIWARPEWGTWWTWDPRLTTTAILWLIYVAYLILRASVEEPERRARFAAVFGIVGFIDVPIVFMAIRWWRTIHPVVITGAEVRMDPPVVLTLAIAGIGVILLFTWLVLQRLRLATVEDELAELRHQLGLTGD